MRRETITYVFALLLIAALTIAFHVVADRIVAQQHDTARTVNISGRQRMLSQRIVSSGLQVETAASPDARAAALDQLRDAMALMAQSHGILTDGSTDAGINPPTKTEIYAIYFGPAYHLNDRVGHFLDLAKVVLASEANPQATPDDLARAHGALSDMIVQANGPLLKALDAAASQYQVDGEAAISVLRTIMASMLVIILSALTAEAMFIFRPLFRRLARQQADLVAASRTDPLTGCLNRRSLMEGAARDFSRARRNALPYTVLLLDIDHFKSVNDTYGHAVGDIVIQALVDAVRASLRTEDLFSRIGGEEFVVFMSDTDGAKAGLVAEKLRRSIESTLIPVEHRCITITASIGIAEMKSGDDAPIAMIERADECMYQAKRTGRNKVVGPELPPRALTVNS